MNSRGPAFLSLAGGVVEGEGRGGWGWVETDDVAGRMGEEDQDEQGLWKARKGEWEGVCIPSF